MLPITLTIAGAAALLNIWLSARTSALRRRLKVLIGDGDNRALAARMRAHANFIEYTPLFLILLALVELTLGPALWLWGLGIFFILGRIAHLFGMEIDKPHPLRIAGMIVTLTALGVLAVAALALPYLEGPGEALPAYARLG
ncbi:MAG: MAPEG family protein [Sphingomonadaceae bacterium]